MENVRVIPKSIFEVSDTEKIAKISKNYMQAKDQINERKEKWSRNYKYYLGKREAQTQEGSGYGKSSLFIPKLGEKVDWMTAKIKQAMSNYRPVINIRARHTDYNLTAELLESAIDYQVVHCPHWRQKITDLSKDAMIKDIGTIKIFWDFDKDMAVFDSIARENFLIDPYARYLDEAEFAIHRYYITRSQLWALRKEGKKGIYDIKILKEIFKNADPVVDEETPDLEQEDKDVEESEEGRFEIVEYWTKEGLITTVLWNKVIQGDDKRENQQRMSVIRTQKDILKLNRLPFASWVYNPKPHQFDGFGIVSRGKDIQDEINTKHRQALDHASHTVKPRWDAPEDYFSQSEQDKFSQNRAGELLKHKKRYGAGFINPLRIPPLSGNIFQELGILLGELDNVTGIYQHAQGQQLSRKETATTTLSILQRADLLFGSLFEDFANDVLIPLGQIYTELNRTFRKKPFLTTEHSEDGMTQEFLPKVLELDGDFEYTVNVSAIMGSNEMQRAQYMQIFQMIGGNPQVAQILGIDLKKLFKKILSTFDQIKNPEELMEQPQPQMGQMGQMGQLPQGLGLPTAGMAPGGMLPTPPTNVPRNLEGMPK